MVTTLVTQLGAHGWHDGDAPAFWPVFPIMFGLFWLAVLGAAFYLLRRRMTTAAAAADPLAKAHAVLAERYARGEIDEDEYRNRAATLRGGH
ncbi:MAG TPA: SHOCT domain-containing protein [Spirillospora sp.]